MGESIKELIGEQELAFYDAAAPLIEKESIDKCPRCGNKLIVRNGKYGDFLGCSNYPDCKYTREL